MRARNPRRSIAPTIAEVILVAVTITIAVLVAAYLLGLVGSSQQQPVQFQATLLVESPHDHPYYPIPGYAVIEAWSEPAGPGQYTLHIRLTATRDLGNVWIHADLYTNGGDSRPLYAGNPTITWEIDSLPDGWYTQQSWTPILEEEYPLLVKVVVRATG